MLSIHKMTAGQETYYTQLAREDYYTKGGEPPGSWRGQGAAGLGLTGEVSARDLSDLFQGKLAGRQLRQHQNTTNRQTQPGWDLTFSAPKTVSTIWSQLTPEKRLGIQAAHEAAVTKALGYIEERCGWTRRGKGGQQLEKASLLFATYEHGTSRAMDPQLHTHALMLNVGIREDGTTGALHTPSLYRHKMAAGNLYQAELALQLSQRLGLEPVKERVGFRVAGVSRELTTTLSKRREEIEAKLREQGRSGAVASEQVARQTRSTKVHGNRSELMGQWQKVGREHGWSTQEAELLAREPRELDPQEQKMRAQLAADKALEKLSHHQTTFTEPQLTRFAAEAAQDSATGIDAVLAAVNALLASQQVVSVGQVRGDEERFTTQEILDLEQKMMGAAGRLRDQEPSLRVEDEVVAGAVGKKQTLTTEQEAGMRHLTAETGRVAVLVGDAGTGKTFMLDAARDAWERAGHQVIGAALSGKAAEGLEAGAGIPSRTIASLTGTLAWIKEQPLEKQEKHRIIGPETVLVIDEAGMVGTRQMEKLLSEVEAVGAKLVLVGDQKQLQAIEFGGGFGAISKAVGSRSLTEVKRQSDPVHARAISDLARGRAEQSLSYYARNGWLSIEEDRVAARAALLHRWTEQGGGRRPADHLMLAGRNADVRKLNTAAQEARLEAGRIRGGAVEVEGSRFFRGDRIVFTKNDYSLKVKNGQFATIRGVSPKLGLVTVDLDEDRGSRTFSVKDQQDFQLGYAVTTHKAQGSTVDRAYVLTDEAMQDRELSYVQLSRARERTEIFTTREEAGEDLEQLVRQLDRSRQEQLATSQKHGQEQKR